MSYTVSTKSALLLERLTSMGEQLDSTLPSPSDERTKQRNFSKYLLAMAASRDWMIKNPNLCKKMISHCFTLLKDPQQRLFYRQLLDEVLPKIKEAGVITDDLKVGALVSKELLAMQSDFFQRMLQGFDFKEKRTIAEGKPLELSSPSQLLMEICSSRKIPKLSFEDLIALTSLAKEQMVEATALPLIEETLMEMITIDNVFWLSFFSFSNQMERLNATCCHLLHQEVDDESAFEMLEALKDAEAYPQSEHVQSIRDICLNHLLDTLVNWDLEGEKAKRLYEELKLLKHHFSYSLHKTHSLISHFPESIEMINLSRMEQKALPKELSRFKKLKTLVAQECPHLYNITQVKELTHLQELDFTDCKSLKNITPMKGLKELRRIALKGCLQMTATQFQAFNQFQCDFNGLIILHEPKESIKKTLEGAALSRGFTGLS